MRSLVFTWWAPIALVLAWGSTHWLLRESSVWRDRNTDEVRAAIDANGRIVVLTAIARGYRDYLELRGDASDYIAIKRRGVREILELPFHGYALGVQAGDHRLKLHLHAVANFERLARPILLHTRPQLRDAPDRFMAEDHWFGMYPDAA